MIFIQSYLNFHIPVIVKTSDGRDGDNYSMQSINLNAVPNLNLNSFRKIYFQISNQNLFSQHRHGKTTN